MKRSSVIWALGFIAMACQGPSVQPDLLPNSIEGWQRTTATPLNYPIPGHMDNYREIFINSVGESVAQGEGASDSSWNYPPGTIIAKMIYPGSSPGPESQPMAITAMVKAPEDPRSQGGWIWLVKDLSTGKERVFSEEFCLSCHGDANESHPYGEGNPEREFRDYVFFPYRP